MLVLVYTLLFPEEQTSEGWKPFKKQYSFGNQEALGRKVLSLSI
jgi:hypothetical protein